MGVKDTIQLKMLIKLDKYSKIVSIISSDHPNLSSLTTKEKLKLINYSLDSNNKNMLYELIDYVSKETRQEIIARLYEKAPYISYNPKFELYFTDFLETGIEKQINALLYHLANIISHNEKQYLKEKEQLTSYLMICPIDMSLIAIANLKGFGSQNLQKRIVQCNNPELIAEYLMDSKKNKIKSILKNYFLSNPSSPNFSELLLYLKNENYLIIKIINSIIKYTDNKSEYLRLVLEITTNKEIRTYLISQILIFNDYQTIAKIVPNLTLEEQNKYAKEALREKLNPIIFTLACTSICDETKHLITYIIAQKDTYELACLLANLKEPFLSYAKAKITQEKDIDFTNILETLNMITTIDINYLLNSADLKNLQPNTITKIMNKENEPTTPISGVKL